MQRLIILTAIFLLTISASNCNEKKKETGKIYKGKLEIKAICMNYTISLREGVQSDCVECFGGGSHVIAFFVFY